MRSPPSLPSLNSGSQLTVLSSLASKLCRLLHSLLPHCASSSLYPLTNPCQISPAVHYADTFYYRDAYGDYYVNGASPSQINFLLFASIWTLLANLYLELTPRLAPSLAHKFAVAAVDGLTALFWFAGFIALAAMVGGPDCGGARFCEVLEAAIAFGAFLW